MRVFSSLAALALLSACATTSQSGDIGDRDPLQGFNRAMWGLNRGVDTVLLKPVSTVYRTITPRPARSGISHIFSNLTEPWSFVNNLLQGKPKRAIRNLGRFVVNTTIGVGGLADHATKIGIPAAPEDFGQTLATWGFKNSPYLVLPILGPSTIRDGVGSGVAFFADPVNVCLREKGCIHASTTERYAITGAQIVSTRAELTESGADTLLAGSLDSYATARSAYLQRRRAMIADEDGGDTSSTTTPSPDANGATGDAALDAAIRDLEADGGTNDAADAPATPEASPPASAPATPPETPSDTPSVENQSPQ